MSPYKGKFSLVILISFICLSFLIMEVESKILLPRERSVLQGSFPSRSRKLGRAYYRPPSPRSSSQENRSGDDDDDDDDDDDGSSPPKRVGGS